MNLSAREVHVWTVCTEASDAITDNFESVLSVDERTRAARLRFDDLRRSFIIKRGVLRHLLARYLGVTPESIRFSYGSSGKPSIALGSNIEFNTTHSGNMAAFAITVGCQVGIDIAQIRPLPEMQAIIDRFFCEEEAAELMSLSPSEREQAFFCCWTRKEAYLKTTGDGLSTQLDEFCVTLRPGETARLVHIARDTSAADAWTLHDLPLMAGYAAALAYRDRPRSLAVFPIIALDEFIAAT